MSIPITYHPTGNLNFTIVEVGELSFAYSYETVIAFSARDGLGWTVSRNYWGPTTGKHLNSVDPDHSKRLGAAEFTAELAKLA